jgi:tellurite resistance protein TerC
VLYVALALQAALVLCAYRLETRSRAEHPGGQARGALIWSGVWLVLGLLPTLIFGLFQSAHAASSYAAVYLIERALSLDNVFVFAVLIAAFEIPHAKRDRMVSYGALSAYALRVPAILLGVAVFEASHVVGYLLGALLLMLAWRTARSGAEQPQGPNRILTALQRRLRISPMLLCLIAIMLADITFAVDSIPAALAISHDSVLLLSSNLLALLGLRALYHLVTIARERLLYMDQTIGVLLALVGLKLLLGGVLTVGPLESLGLVLGVLAAGTGVSLRGSSRMRKAA